MRVETVKKDEQKGNKVMFYAGIGLVIVAAVLLLGNFMGESTFPTMLGVLGVITIATSNFRIL